MKATIFQNKTGSITVVELDGQYFPFINVSGEIHNSHKLLKMILCPTLGEDAIHYRTFSTCLSFAWRTARKDIGKQKKLDRSWHNKGRNYNSGYPKFLQNYTFRVMDYIQAWNDEKKVWTT